MARSNGHASVRGQSTSATGRANGRTDPIAPARSWIASRGPQHCGMDWAVNKATEDAHMPMAAGPSLTEHLARSPRHCSFYLACGQEDATPIIFVHGWPELSISWRGQLPVFAGLGFRAIAPDMRGYGRSSVPPRRQDYALELIVGDMIELLELDWRAQGDLGRARLGGPCRLVDRAAPSRALPRRRQSLRSIHPRWFCGSHRPAARRSQPLPRGQVSVRAVGLSDLL